MKKLLAMLVVVGLASFASGAGEMSFDLVPTVPGSLDNPLNPSEWVELDILYTGIVPLWSSGSLFVSIDGPGEWCGPDADTYDPPGLPLDQAWTWHEKFDPDYAVEVPGVGTFPFPGIHRLAIHSPQLIEIGGSTDLNESLGIVDGEILFDHLNIHCTGPGEVIVTLTPSVQTGGLVGLPTYWDQGLFVGDDGAIGDSITIHQIPEPMTMTLIGLGGLALLRRRR
jgi:hypothetical protein